MPIPLKSTAPVVPLAVWKDLYSAAEIFRTLRPWEALDDRDLIGVRDFSSFNDVKISDVFCSF